MMKASSESGPADKMGTEDACLKAAYRYLASRSRSEAELRRRLQQRGYDSGSIEKTLVQLKEKGFTDDSAFARQWIENRESFSPRSRFLLQRELRGKGVKAETIAKITAGFDDSSSAYRAAQKKAKTIRDSDHSSFRNKLLGFLRRRGFDFEVSQRTVNRLWEERSKGEQDA